MSEPVTGILSNASLLPRWTASELEAVLREIRRIQREVEVEWDLGAGEGWARLSSDGELCALIRAPTTVNSAPRVAFLNRGCGSSPTLGSALEAAGVEVFTVADFDAPIFSIDSSDLKDFVDGPLPPSHVFNPHRFAVNDLVFVSE